MAPPPQTNRSKKTKSPGLFGSLFSSGKTVAPESKRVSSKTTSKDGSRLTPAGKALAPLPAGSKAPAPAAVNPASAEPVTLAAQAAAAKAVTAVSAAPAMHPADAAAAWLTRPRVPSRLLETHVNFMVMGESGLGKTTFISNLTSTFQVANAMAVQDGSSTTLSQFQAAPESLRTVLAPMDIPESSRRLIISIQDMPGWGDDINLMRYLRIVTAFLLEQRARDYERLAGSRSMDEVAMCGRLASSITACLYFLPPHRVKKIDLILMAAISQLVTIIPVIGKSDSMTEGELSLYRAEVLHMLRNPSNFVSARNLPRLDVSLFSFADTIMADLGLDKSQLPVAIVCSREEEPLNDPSFVASLGLDSMENPCQPVRHYRWGSCYPLNRNHSELIALKRLLLGDRVDSLYAMLDDSYRRYTEFCSAYEDSGKQLQMVVQEACQVGGPHLEYDDYAKAKVALDSAKAAMSTLSEENRMLAERLAAVEKEKKALAERLRGGL